MLQFLQQQLRLMVLITERQSTPQQTSQETKLCIARDAESVERSITEFHMYVKSTFPE